MSNFLSENAGVKGFPEHEETSSTQIIDFSAPVQVIYCPTCSMPCEFCEYGACFSKCLPWILENCREALSTLKLAELENSGGNVLEGEKKKEKPKGGGAAAPKKATILETKVIITRVQRQKRKFVTVVGGLESVPDLKIKDASRTFGKKFSSGCSVNESQTGAKEVVIQGDVLFDLPAILMSEFKVAADAIFILEDGSLRPFR